MNDKTRNERQQRFYEKQKATGDLKKNIRVSPEIKNRFDAFRAQRGMSVDDAIDYLLSKENA